MRKIQARIHQWYSTYHKLLKVSLVTASSHLGYGVLNQSAIPPYVEVLGWVRYVGVIYAFFIVAETLFKAPMGSLADKIGRRPVYVIAAVVGAVSAYLWTVVRRLWIILLVRVIDGTTSAGVWTASIVAIGGTVTSERRTTAMGVFTVTYLGGLALGPLLGGYSNDVTGSKMASFYVSAALFIIAAILAYFMMPAKQEDEIEAIQTPFSFKEMGVAIWLALKAIPDYMLIAFVSFYAFGLVIPIIKLFALQQLGMSETTYGLIALPVASICAIATLASGRLADLWGRARSVHVGIAIGAIFMSTVPLIHSDFHFAITATLIGIGFVIAMPSWLAIVTDMTEPGARGAVMGAVGTGQGIGVLVGTILGGFLYESVPLSLFGRHLNSHFTPFIVSALALALCFVLALVFVRDTVRKITD
ncbi:MAG TPA: MFS transporter [Armatimonadota bacterium]|nr:MFS transporter [Armatimonadota bacterium]